MRTGCPFFASNPFSSSLPSPPEDETCEAGWGWEVGGGRRAGGGWDQSWWSFHLAKAAVRWTVAWFSVKRRKDIHHFQISPFTRDFLFTCTAWHCSRNVACYTKNSTWRNKLTMIFLTFGGCSPRNWSLAVKHVFRVCNVWSYSLTRGVWASLYCHPSGQEYNNCIVIMYSKMPCRTINLLIVYLYSAMGLSRGLGYGAIYVHFFLLYFFFFFLLLPLFFFFLLLLLSSSIPSS